MHKHNVLVVHSQLAQHGSERLLFELLKLLLQEGAKVDVMVRPFGVVNQHYYSLLRKLNVVVFRRMLTFRHITFLFKSLRNSRSYFAKYVRKIYSIFAEYTYFRMSRTYDRIIVVGMETYCDSFAFMVGNKSFIHVHHVMHQFQQDRDYSLEYDLDRIIVCDEQQRREVLRSMPNITVLLCSLPISLPTSPLQRSHRDFAANRKLQQPIRIGVVSRLKLDRPNEPILQHFAALASVCSAELHFFGSGDHKAYSSLLNDLRLTSRQVIFHNHANDIGASFKESAIDIAWSVSMMGSISYAAIELITIGVPVFLINIGDPVQTSTTHALNCINSKIETIEFHQSLMRNPGQLDKILQSQWNFIQKTHNIESLKVKLLTIYNLPIK